MCNASTCSARRIIGRCAGYDFQFFELIALAKPVSQISEQSSSAVSRLWKNVKTAFKNNDKILARLSRPGEVKFPTSVTLGKSEYQLTGFVAKGSDGAVYLAHDVRNPDQPLMVKAMFSSDGSFERERDALLVMKRLVAVDDAHAIIVQPKIEGTGLNTLLENTHDKRVLDRLTQDYGQLSQDFYKQWGLIHGDIRPANVIVDSTGKMHLIDYGQTIKAPADAYKARILLATDREIAAKELNFFNIETNAFWAIDNPLSPDAIKYVDAYKAALINREDIQKANQVQAVFDHARSKAWRTPTGVRPDPMLPRLSRPREVKLPTKVTIGKSEYQLTGYLSKGAEGVVYLAHPANNAGEALVIKAMIENKGARASFNREREALKVMNRLVADDEAHMVIVQPKIQGTGLDTLLERTTDPRILERLKHEYLYLSQNFYKQWGLVHGDIRPANVIVDTNGKMQLIDFGRTVKAPADEANLKALLSRDQSHAAYELDFFNIETKGFWALDNPLDPKAAEYADDYAKALVHRKDSAKAAAVQKQFKSAQQSAMIKQSFANRITA